MSQYSSTGEWVLELLKFQFSVHTFTKAKFTKMLLGNILTLMKVGIKQFLLKAAEICALQNSGNRDYTNSTLLCRLIPLMEDMPVSRGYYNTPPAYHSHG